jgi:hypothetical protein
MPFNHVTVGRGRHTQPLKSVWWSAEEEEEDALIAGNAKE